MQTAVDIKRIVPKTPDSPTPEPEPQAQPSRAQQCEQKQDEISAKMDAVRRRAKKRLEDPELQDWEREGVERSRDEALHKLQLELDEWQF